MLRIYAPQLVAVFIDMAQVAGHLNVAATNVEAVEAQEKMKVSLREANKVLDTIPLSNPQREFFLRLVSTVNVDKKFTPRDAFEAEIMAKEFVTNALSELRASYFLMIPAERRIFFEQLRPPFGDNVSLRFLAANRDIAASSRCFALDEWTACIFHLMRVLEIGLRDLARRLKVKVMAKGKAKPLDYAQWSDVLRPLSEAIKNLPRKTPPQKRRHEFYSQLASDFSHFKDAWRNHVMHAREPYDENDAVIVYASVSRFMQRLADGPPN